MYSRFSYLETSRLAFEHFKHIYQWELTYKKLYIKYKYNTFFSHQVAALGKQG